MTGEWRKVEVDAPDGASTDHTAYEYQFGAEIDGVFIPAVTKSGGYIDALVRNAQATQAENPSPTTDETPAPADDPAA